MKRQEIFDTVTRHLLRQRRKSQAYDGTCLYRGPAGTKCAVGCLLTDEEASRCVEGQSPDGLLVDGTLPSRLRRHVGFLEELQPLHDDNEPSEWRELLCQLGRSYGLKLPAALTRRAKAAP